MNRLDTSRRVRLLAALVEGNGVRATARMNDCSPVTVLKFIKDMGEACEAYHDANVRNLRVRHLQCDEAWCFIGAKAKNVSVEKKAEGWGDVWTWVGLDADSKLVVSYLVGGRSGLWASAFMDDCASRISNRVRTQITTDQHAAYLEAVEGAFGADIDYAMLHKIYGAPTDADQRRYSPATCIGSDMKTVSGNPNPKHVSTSFVERQNLTLRMHIRRFTRLSNGFSKKFENHCYAVAIHYMFYNYCRIHQTLRVTPSMEAGIANHAWSLEELVSILEHKELAMTA